MSLVPELLLKDELIFEIKLRKAVPAGKTKELRKQLRSLINSEAEILWPADIVSSEELEVCTRKLEEWEAESEGWVELPAGRDKPRVTVRISHLINRVKLLAAEGGLQAGELVSLTQGIVMLEGLLQRVAASPTPVTSVPSNSIEIISEEPASTENTVSLPGSSVSVISTSNLGNTPTLNTLTSTTTASEFPVTSPRITPPITGNDVSSRSTVQFSAVSAVSYNRLPNPLTPYLHNLPVIDGLNIEDTLRFLSVSIQMRDFPGVRDTELVMILTGYCRPPLSERLRDFWQKGNGFEDFHREVLSFCIPGRMLENLKMSRFYRPQRLGENLSNFIAEIKEARRVLRLPHSEEETIQVLLEGLAPEERSRLALSRTPQTFADLDNWCVQSQNIQYLDTQRQGMAQPRPSVPTNPTVMAIRAEVPDRGPRRPWVCYSCNKPGHIQRFCPERGNSRRLAHTSQDPGDPKNL